MDELAQALLILLVIIALVALVLRGVLLWFWRVNEQLDVLHQIDKRLERLNKNIEKLQNSSENQTVPAVPSPAAPAKEEAPVISKSDIPEM